MNPKALPAALLLLGVMAHALSGCKRDTVERGTQDTDSFPLARAVDDPAAAEAGTADLAGAADFRLTFGDGSGWEGYNVLKVDADGRCVYTSFEWVQNTDPQVGGSIQQWKRAEFVLDGPMVAELRTVLVEIDYWRMKREYHADVHDGTQRWAKVEASGKRKGVYCNNHFPAGFQRLHGFVEERIIRAHGAEVKAAKVIEFSRKDAESEFFE